MQAPQYFSWVTAGGIANPDFYTIFWLHSLCMKTAFYDAHITFERVKTARYEFSKRQVFLGVYNLHRIFDSIFTTILSSE